MVFQKWQTREVKPQKYNIFLLDILDPLFTHLAFAYIEVILKNDLISGRNSQERRCIVAEESAVKDHLVLRGGPKR
jgi:hypothetical protein